MADDLARQLTKVLSTQTEALVAGVTEALTAQLGPVMLNDHKKDQDAVSYRPAEGTARCEVCTNFLVSGKCKAVRGQIDPNYWCELYEPRMRLVERTSIPTISQEAVDGG